MNSVKQIKPIFVLFLSVLLLSSCLKDEPFMDFSELQPVIEFPYTTRKIIQTFEGTGQQDMTFIVNYAFAKPAKEDIAVTIAVDPERVSSYGAAYAMLPANAYSFVSNSAVIRKGEYTAEYTVRVNPANIPDGSFVVPLIIQDAQGHIISGNFGHLFLELKK